MQFDPESAEGSRISAVSWSRTRDFARACPRSNNSVMGVARGQRDAPASTSSQNKPFGEILRRRVRRSAPQGRARDAARDASAS